MPTDRHDSSGEPATRVGSAPATPSPALAGRLAALSKSDYAIIVLLFVASRALLVLIGYLTLYYRAPPSQAPLLPDLFVRWDSLWYLATAQFGYSPVEPPGQPGSTNFGIYPLYPALIWTLHQLTGLSFAAAGVLISNACFLAALFVIFAYGVSLTQSRATSLMAVALICFIPEGFVFSAVYTESLFVLLTIAPMWAYSRQHYAAAAVLSALGTLVRSNGVLIIVWYGLEIVRKRGLKGALRFWEHPQEYLPIAVAPLGLVAFWWFAYLSTGDAFAQKSTVLHGWGWTPAFPWDNIVRNLQHGNINERFWITSGLIAFALSFTLLRRGYWTLFAYCAVNFALYFTGTSANSLLRYSIAIVPIYYGIAWYVARSRILAGIAFGISAALGAALMLAWTLGAVTVI